MPKFYVRIALFAVVSASLAACGSPSAPTGQPAAPTPSPGVSQPSTGGAAQSGGGVLSGITPTTTSIPMPPNPSESTPGAVQPASSCGIYLIKPSLGQWLDDLKTDAGKDWDSLPPQSQQLVSRAQFIDNIVSPLKDDDLQGVTAVQIFVSAPADKIAQYGKIYCEAEKLTYSPQDMLPAVRANPSENLIYGLNYCKELTFKNLPAKNEPQLKFEQGIQ